MKAPLFLSEHRKGGRDRHEVDRPPEMSQSFIMHGGHSLSLGRAHDHVCVGACGARAIDRESSDMITFGCRYRAEAETIDRAFIQVVGRIGRPAFQCIPMNIYDFFCQVFS